MTARMKPEAVRAWIGLGSNLGDPVHQLNDALAALETFPSTRLLRVSSFYRSRPMGPQDQPDFVNAVAELDTALPALQLLDALQAVEQAQGRVRGQHWGPRTLDLDLLLYGNERISLPRLEVPHPGLPERAFVLYPLAELDPDLDIPGVGSIDALCRRQSPSGLQRMTQKGNGRHPA